MGTLLAIVVILLICVLLLVGLTLGLAFVLSKILPSVAFGMCVIADAVLAVGILDLLVRFVAFSNRLAPDSPEGVEIDDPVIVVPESFLPRSLRRSRKQKRKKVHNLKDCVDLKRSITIHCSRHCYEFARVALGS